MADIRLATSADAAAVRAIYAPYVLETAVSFETEVPTIEEMARRIESITATHSWLICEDALGICGYAYGGPHAERAAYRWSTDVTVYTDARVHRKGVGRALYTALFQHLRLLGYFTAYGGITQPNEASVGLHKAMGFEPAGFYEGVGFKHGKWHDVAWLTLRLQERTGAPQELRRPREVSQDPRWEAALREGERRLRI